MNNIQSTDSISTDVLNAAAGFIDSFRDTPIPIEINAIAIADRFSSVVKFVVYPCENYVKISALIKHDAVNLFKATHMTLHLGAAGARTYRNTASTCWKMIIMHCVIAHAEKIFAYVWKYFLEQVSLCKWSGVSKVLTVVCCLGTDRQLHHVLASADRMRQCAAQMLKDDQSTHATRNAMLMFNFARNTTVRVFNICTKHKLESKMDVCLNYTADVM